MSFRAHNTALCLLAASLGGASAGGGTFSSQTALLTPDRTSRGAGFTLSDPQVDAVALGVRAGH